LISKNYLHLPAISGRVPKGFGLFICRIKIIKAHIMTAKNKSNIQPLIMTGDAANVPEDTTVSSGAIHVNK
jgi:hypothetical protein